MNGKNISRDIFVRNFGYVVQGILVALSFCIIHGLRTSGIMANGIIFLYIVVKYKNNVALERRERVVQIILSAIFSFFIALGEILTVLDSGFTFSWILTFLLVWVGQFLLMETIVEYLLVLLRNKHIRYNKRVDITLKDEKHIFIFSLLILLIVWGFGWIRTYPGSMSRDSIQIASMALGKIDLLPAVPIVYVYPIRLFWTIGEKIFGSPNAGLGLCTFVQMLGVALIVAYSIMRLYSNRVSKWICMLILAYYAFMPYNAYMLTTIWKDVPFAAFMLLFLVLLGEYYWENKINNKVLESIRLVAFIISGIGICLMRNNGLFAYLLFIPFGLIVFYKKDKKVFISIIAIIILTRIIQGPVYDKIMTAHAEARIEREMAISGINSEENTSTEVVVTKVDNATDGYNATGIYVITAQQLANVAVDRADLSVEEYERLNRVIDVEQVRINYAEKSAYCRRCIDMTLPLIRYDTPMQEYVKTWVYFGVKYPINYILGWRGQTIGYWYPDIQNWTTIDEIIDNELQVYKTSVLNEKVAGIIDDLDHIYKKIPGYGLLWSIGFMVWVNIFCAGLTYIKKGISSAVFYIPLIGVWLTLLVATPIYAEFRYAYSLYLCLPISILFPFIGEKKNNNGNK